MKHFIGGFALGFMVSLVFLQQPKKATEMNNTEFLIFVGAHFVTAILFGLTAWGLL